MSTTKEWELKYREGKYIVPIKVEITTINQKSFVTKVNLPHLESNPVLADKFFAAMQEFVNNTPGASLSFDPPQEKIYCYYPDKDSGREERKLWANRQKDSLQTTFTCPAPQENANAHINNAFNQITKNFLSKNNTKMFVETESCQTKINKLFSQKISLFTLPEQKQNIKALFEKLQATYPLFGKKFFLFANNPQRATILEQLERNLVPYFSEQALLTDEGKKSILSLLISAKKEIIASHTEESFFGKVGITKSRLAEGINTLLRELVTCGCFSQSEIDQENNMTPAGSAVNSIMAGVSRRLQGGASNS